MTNIVTYASKCLLQEIACPAYTLNRYPSFLTNQYYIGYGIRCAGRFPDCFTLIYCRLD